MPLPSWPTLREDSPNYYYFVLFMYVCLFYFAFKKHSRSSTSEGMQILRAFRPPKKVRAEPFIYIPGDNSMLVPSPPPPTEYVMVSHGILQT